MHLCLTAGARSDGADLVLAACTAGAGQTGAPLPNACTPQEGVLEALAASCSHNWGFFQDTWSTSC